MRISSRPTPRGVPGRSQLGTRAALWRLHLVGVAALLFWACGGEGPTTPPSPPAAAGAPTEGAYTTAPEPDPAQIGTPTGLHVSATGANFIEFSWNRVPGVLGYNIQLSTNEIFTADDPTFGVVEVPWESLHFRAEDLSPGDIIHARVSSVQGRTQSPWSVHVTGMAGIPPPLPPPAGLGAVSVFGLVVTGTGVDNYSRIPDAIVGATNLDTMRLEDFVLTNQYGGYAFEELPGDRYRFDVAALGYRRPPPQYARADADQPEKQLDFWLTEDLGPPRINRSRFSRSTWDEMGFNSFECREPDDCPEYWENPETGETRPIEHLIDRRLRVLPTASPNFHIRTHNDQGRSRLPGTWVRRIREAIPGIVGSLTGERYTGEITSGRQDVEAPNWITIEASTESDDPDWWESDDPDWFICGRARIGAIYGQVWLNKDRIGLSARRGRCGLEAILAHEIGHSLGFFHTSSSSNVMTSGSGVERFSSGERYHAELAYAYGRFTPYFAGPHLTASQEPRPPQSPVVSCPMRVR